MSNPSAESPQSMRYFFPPRAEVFRKGEDERDPQRIRFRVFWGHFIRHAAKKAPIDQNTAYVLDLFNEIEFHVSQETFHRLENMLSTAVSLSENRQGAKPINVMWPCESAAYAYFDALYSPENHSSQVHPATLRMIAKYLFAVQNLPIGRVRSFAPRYYLGEGIAVKSQRDFHGKVVDAISAHYSAWGKAEEEAPESREKEEASAPEAPVASHKKVPYTKFPLVVWSGTTQQKETRTFYLHWHRLIEEAQAKHPLDKETRDALVLFNKILFTVPKKTFEQLEALKQRAKQLSETPSAVEIYGVREEEIAVGKYFYALFSSENHDSQVAPTTLRKIAKYLFAVCHFPDKALDFATALDFPLDANIYSDSVPDNLLRHIHWKAVDKIREHWLAFNNQDESPQPLEYAQATETPVAPAEEPAFPDVESIMVSAFAEFEKGKSLTEVGGLICDAVGLRELYEEQLEDPKNRAILALGEGLIRSLGTLLRPNREKPFVMTPPVCDTARPIQPSDPIAARPPKKMGEVIAEMLQRQHEEAEAQKKKDEIAEAFRQREEAIRQAKEAADAKFQEEVARVNGSPAATQNDATPDGDGMAQFRKRIVYNADGTWLPLSGGGRKVTGEQQLKKTLDEILAAPGDAWEEARRQVAKGDRPLSQILADLRERQNIASLEAKEAEERALSEKIREHFAGQGEDFVAQLRKRIVSRENKSN